MQPGVNPHRHAERQCQSSGNKAELEGRRHPFQDYLRHRSRLLVGKTELATCGTTDKAGKLHDEAVVEAELLPQVLAIGEAGILTDHAFDRVADIIE
jgi:hypothetical protein